VPDAVLGGTASGRVVGQGGGSSGSYATRRPGETMHGDDAQPSSLSSRAVRAPPTTGLTANRRVPPLQAMHPSARLCRTPQSPIQPNSSFTRKQQSVAVERQGQRTGRTVTTVAATLHAERCSSH